MAWSIGLHLGEHFCEVVAQWSADPSSPADGPQPTPQSTPPSTTPSTLVKKRFFTPQMAPEAALGQFLTENQIQKIDRIQMASTWPRRIIEARHGSSIAVLTTSGFENWIELNQPTTSAFFTPHPARPAPLFDPELSLGVNERVNAQGHIEKLIDESELEFLCAKLELNQIKNVAVCFLHSNKNSANESTVKKYLEAKGYSVYCSHQVIGSRRQSSAPPALDETTRFLNTIGNAYCRPLFIERLQKLNELLTPLVGSADQIRLGDLALAEALANPMAPLGSSIAPDFALSDQFALTAPLFYAGAEEFLLLSGPTAASGEGQRLRIQPLSPLGRTFLSPISFSPETLSYDPGPISFGRGLTATFFDLLAAHKDFVAPQGLAEKITERGRARLNEFMSAHARSSSEKLNMPTEQLIADLLKLAGEILRDEVRQVVRSAPAEIRMAGPLADALAPLLRISGFKVTVVAEDFLSAKALLMTGGGLK